MWTQGRGTASARALKVAIAQFDNTFSGFGQHDAQELLSSIIDALHEETNRVGEKPLVEIAKQGPNESDDDAAAAAEEAFRRRDDSPVYDQLLGLVKSVLTLPGGTTSTTFEPIMYLSVPIPTRQDNNSLSITDCIRHYSETEELESGGRKQLQVYRTPPLFIVHFKRFGFSTATGREEKIDTPVRFPLYGLELGDSVYDCFAVSIHSGTARRGHYTACCKEVDRTWTRYDDGIVTPDVTESEVVKSQAYLLFYRRRGDDGDVEVRSVAAAAGFGVSTATAGDGDALASSDVEIDVDREVGGLDADGGSTAASARTEKDTAMVDVNAGRLPAPSVPKRMRDDDDGDDGDVSSNEYDDGRQGSGVPASSLKQDASGDARGADSAHLDSQIDDLSFVSSLLDPSDAISLYGQSLLSEDIGRIMMSRADVPPVLPPELPDEKLQQLLDSMGFHPRHSGILDSVQDGVTGYSKKASVALLAAGLSQRAQHLDHDDVSTEEFDLSIRCENQFCQQSCLPALKHKCPTCHLEVCRNCWYKAPVDRQDECYLCAFEDQDHFDEPSNDNRSFWNFERLEFVKDNCPRNAMTCSQMAQVLNAEFSCVVDSKKIDNLFRTGTADVLCLLNADGLRVPFNDLVTFDEYGNGTWTDAAIENMRRFREAERPPVAARPARRFSQSDYSLDVRDNSPILASLYSEVDPQLLTATLNPEVDSSTRRKRTPEFLDHRRRRKRNLILDATFEFLWRQYFGLFRHFLPDDLFEGHGDADLSSIDPSTIVLSHEGKRSAILDLIRTIDIVPEWYESSFLNVETEIRQCSRDEEIKNTLKSIDANILARWDYIKLVVQYWCDMVSTVAERCFPVRRASLIRFTKSPISARLVSSSSYTILI